MKTLNEGTYTKWFLLVYQVFKSLNSAWDNSNNNKSSKKQQQFELSLLPTDRKKVEWKVKGTPTQPCPKAVIKQEPRQGGISAGGV